MSKKDFSNSSVVKAYNSRNTIDNSKYSNSNVGRAYEDFKLKNQYSKEYGIDYSQNDKEIDTQTKINNLIASNPYMRYDLDAMKSEYQELITKRNATPVLSSNSYNGSSLLTHSQIINSTRELDDAISKKGAAINVIERNQARTNFEVDALNDSDFKFYSNKGSKIQNPTREEAQAGITFGANFGNNNDPLHIGGKKVNNIVTYSRDNYDSLKTYDIDEPDTEDERINFRNNIGDEKYHFMTDDEVNVYNYYLAKENAGLIEKGTAQKYLDAIDYELNSRVAQDMGDYVGDSSFLANIFGLTAATESHYVGLGNAIDMYVNPDNVEVNPSALQLGDSVARENQGVLGKFSHDLISTTANMMPSIIASSVANLIVPGSGAVIGSTIMGASAAGNEYQNMLFQGYSHEAAKTDAELTGLSEAVMQYALGGIKAFGGKGIEKILGKELKPITEGIKNATARAIADYGIDMGKEALEEGVQEIVAPYIKAYATGEIPEDIDWESVFYSALLGGVNAGILNAGNIGKASYVPFDNIQQNTSSNFLNNGIGVNNETNTETKPNENVLGLPGMSTETEVTSPFTDDGNIDTEAPSSKVEDTINNSDKDLKTQIESLGYDKETNKAIEMGYDPELGIPVSDYVTGVEEGYHYGLVGYPLQQVRQDSTFASLPKSVQDFAYSLGKQAQKSKEVVPTTVSKSNVENAGTVRGEGVKISDLKEAFNDTQGLAYKLISFVAEAGENEVVLFKSEPNADGVYTAPQGMFKSGTNDNAIYIDLNAGIVRAGKVNTPDKLAKYTMFRTFGHEYTHFCQKWNPSGYNSFRTLIFETLNEMGENAEDLIEEEMLLNGTSYEKASNDVVAEAMSEIFMDERTAKSFGEKLYKKSKELFENFLKKLKEFIANLKAHFKILEKNPNNSKTANAVKKEVKGRIEYLDKIYEAYVDMSVGAAENYKNVLNKYRTAETKPVETDTTVKEIDVNSLLNAVTEAQGKANETGEEQSVKLSDHKIDNGSIKHIIEMITWSADISGNPPKFHPTIASIPHDASVQEEKAVKFAKDNKYKLFFNVLSARANMLQVDINDNEDRFADSVVINKFDDWNRVTKRVQADIEHKKNIKAKYENNTEPDVVDVFDDGTGETTDDKPDVVSEWEENHKEFIPEEYQYNDSALKDRIKFDPTNPVTEEEIARIEKTLTVTNEDVDYFIEKTLNHKYSKESYDNFFKEKHTVKETADMLKNNFGDSGASGPGNRSNYSANSKGIEFNNNYVIGKTKDGYLKIIEGPTRKFTWNQIASRIIELNEKNNSVEVAENIEPKEASLETNGDYSDITAIALKILKGKKKTDQSVSMTGDGMYFVGTSYAVARTNKETVEAINKETGFDMTVTAEQIKKTDAVAKTKLTGKAYVHTIDNIPGKKAFVFENGKDQIVVNQKYFKYFAGYDYYYTGNPKAPIIVRNTKGEMVGVVCPITPREKIDTSKLELAKIKGFNQEVTTNENANIKGRVQNDESIGEGTSRLLAEISDGDVRGVSSKRNSTGNSESGRGETGRYDVSSDSTDWNGGSQGDNISGDLRGTDGLTEEEKEIKDEELHETVEEEKEQKVTENPRGNNFVINESLELPKGEKARFTANYDAIRIIKQLEAENRYATAEEQIALSKYVGWGGLSNAFGEMTFNRETRRSEMMPKRGWEDEYYKLRKLVDDGLITEEEYSGMSASTKNAHYTSVEVIKAMYDGLKQLGFDGGRMLEPSSGVGNFVGAMPTEMTSKVNSWTMVELDTITGNISKYLYPNSDVRIEGFEKANIPDNYMDVAIGNVPFGNYGVVDRAYPKRVTKAIHNYFFAKSLDKVRPGGIVMFITSSFTMNGKDTEIRKYIMDRADLIGAIRLPNTAFSDNAGTQVVTDILVLKKRENGTDYNGEEFLNTRFVQLGQKSWEGADINVYFDNHPEMALGTATIKSGMYGSESLTYTPIDGDLGEQIKNAFKNIKARMEYPVKPSAEKVNAEVKKANRKTKNNGFVVNEDGTISQNINGNLEKVNVDTDTAKRITGMLDIRNAYRELVSNLQNNLEDARILASRKALNDAYDNFVKENGYLNLPKNKKAIESDPDRYSILSLENFDVDKKTGTKADIFTKNTVSPNVTINHADSIESAVIVSINTTGGVDTSLIANLIGKSESEVTRQLIDSRLAFKKRDNTLEVAERYLSGNVRAKLKEAEALAPLDKDYINNVEELKRVIPEDVPYSDIYVTPGSPWIPTEVYADFIAEMLGGVNNPSSYRGPDVEVGRSSQTSEFKIVLNNSRLKSRFDNTQKWGTKRRPFLDIIDAMMNSRSVTVKDTYENADGKKVSVVNEVETTAANEKVEEITKAFQEWIWKDESRRKELVSLYNDTFNALATPKYNGEHLTVNGLNPEMSLRPHQANAVQRIISSGGNTLLAHKVGAGKTMEMAAAAMKLRELGLVKKPMFAVPKSLVAQWGNEFKTYFPTAKLLVADDKSFDKDNRRTFTNMIANGDFDAVIVSYEQFEKVPMSIAYQKQFYQEQINSILSAIAEEKAETKGKGLTVKEMEKKRAQLEKKIADLTSKEKDEDNIDFESLGIDSLFVDEAHNFKNLQYVTKMNNIAGLGNTNGSQRAFDLYTKVRYLQSLNNGRGIVFATATPVMNSMAEMYIMQKYLQSDTLNQLGLTSFDAWAKQFGEVVNSLEIKPSGQGFRVKQTFSNFKNLNELQMLFRSFSDVLTDVPGLKIPKMKGGKVQVVECEPGNFQKDYMKELEKRADNVKNVDPSEDNMLKITSDGRKVSYTQRMIDPSLPYEETSKIYKCCEKVIDDYKSSNKIKGTQIIFCDMATPKGKSKTSTAKVEEDTLDEGSAKLYDDMKAILIKKGIPAKEIAFIHDADTDAKKKKLFADVNDGKVRVLIGSTGKMGVGMNAQKRIVAIHHLDAPWRPGDVEQRDGRAFRQGNINDEVTKYTYVTVGSFDARLWDILDRKSHFINQIMNGENVGRTAEDTGDVTLSAAEVKALASGNPMIKEQVELTNDIKKLENLYKAYNSSKANANAKILEDNQKIASLERNIKNAKADISETRVDNYSENTFAMTVGNKKFTDRKDAGTELVAKVKADVKPDAVVKVGTFSGFDIKATKDGIDYIGYLSGKQNYKFNIYLTNTTQMINKMCEVVAGLESAVNNWGETLKETNKDLAEQNKLLNEPFAKQEELDSKRARFNEIMSILNPPEEQVLGDDDVQEQSRNYLNDNIEKEYWEVASMIAELYNSYDPYDYMDQMTGHEDVTIAEQLKSGDFSIIERVKEEYEEYTDDEKRIADDIIRRAEELQGTQYQSRAYLTETDSEGRELSQGQADYFGNSKDIQYQSRREANASLTNTEVLEMAADRVEAMNLPEGEKFALETFKKRLSDLDDLQKERQEQGKLWKEQQFGANSDSAKATETLNRMHILDEKIKKAEADLLSLEEKGVLKKVLEKARKVIEQEDRAKSQEMLKRYRERKRNTENIKKYRDRIKEDVEELSSWITKPDVKKGKMVPDALKDSVIDFLASIDFTSKRGLKGGTATKADVEFVKRIEKLKESIKNQIDLNGMYSGYNDLPEGFMDDLQRFIDNTRKITEQHSGDYVINQMTAEELKELSKVVRVLKSYVTMMNAFHQNAMYQHVEDAGEDTLSYLKKSGKAQNVGEISNYVFWENIRPAFAWERFGKGGKAIYDELVEGQAKLAFNALKVKEFTNGNKEKGIEAAYTEEEVKEWTEKTNEFTIGNDKVSIPIAYIMGIYELYQQEASFKHMISDKGGIRIATYKNGKTKFSDDGHFVDKAKLDEIIGSLTPRQKEVADKLQQFMEKVGGPWGNYVSVARFGIELFTTPHYYPINSDGRHLDNNFEEFPNNASLYALLNASFTKSRIEEANNRIVIYSIFDVFANHMASMAQYNAFALPILDAIKWFNYKESWTGPDGKRQVGRSIREELTKVYGVPEESKPGKGNEGYAVSFIKNIIKAFNGTETQGSPKDTLGIKLLHQHNMAQIAYNLRVVVQQPMSVLRAGLVIDYSSIIKGMQMTPQKAKETLAEMNKYNGIAVWKNELGFYDTNISRGLTSLIKHDKTTLERINEFGMVGAEFADKITWAAMWNACKYEVVRRGTSESDPKFFDKVNALFNEVIYKTQVVDSVLTKTEFMRDKGYWGKAMSSFMSEAVTTASALTDAMFNYFMDLQRGMSRSQAWQKHSKNFGKVVAVYSISAILLAAIQAVMDALRDDDEDESYFEKWGDAFIGNVIDELMPFNKLPIFSDFYDLAKELLSKLGVDTYGNPPTSIFMQYWDSLVNGVGILHDKINGSDKGYTWYGGIKKLLQAASSITGAPLGNITREVVTFWNNTAGALSDNLIVHSYVSGNQEMNKYFNALDSGDTREANKIYSEIIEEKKKDFAESREKEGKTELSDAELESKAKSSVKTSITSHYKEIYVEAYKSKDTDKMAEIRKKIYQTGLYGSVDDVVKTCNNWLSEYR